ncbi:acetyl-CoA-benzylalcohol acetyltransferase-like [Solanum stenotomum]|uniref:acetyl-CoA-benzylalcohol acetyltransferase-like n=1 Tax=Solanum stenotomum TaxID=172797 RepID=UPI0020D19743|nr:acetyl-CoA-benzylalcohol acetyltransferase-like [Solanum stenotomum]
MEIGFVNKNNYIKVEILCTKLIKPSSPTLSHNQCYKLSFFDQIAEREHIPIVLFYPYNNFNSPTIDERLEKSLSKVLTHVYPIAGRYDKDECSILCLDQGVSYTKAKVNCKLDNFLEKAHKDLSLAALFWPHENKNVDQNNFMVSPIIIIQVTKFECGGLALSCSASHPAIDGFTSLNILFGWGKVCRLETPIDKINFLSFNLGNIFPTRDISRLFKSTHHVANREENIVVKRFVVREAALSRLRKQCIDESGGALNFQPSRVEIITAILWRALIRISAARNGYFRSSLMDFPLNLRSKSSLPQLNNSMGNFRIDIPIKFIPGETKMELHNFIILIRNTVNKVVALCAKTSPDEIVSTLVNIYNESVRSPEWGGNDEVDKVTCSSICKFPLQDIDFGLGKPSLIYFGLKDMEMFWLYDTDCHTEVGVQLDLKESCMQLFECDNDIKALMFIRDAKL